MLVNTISYTITYIGVREGGERQNVLLCLWETLAYQYLKTLRSTVCTHWRIGLMGKSSLEII